MNTLRRFLADTRATLEEAAFVIPILALVTIAMVNLTMLYVAQATASHAAQSGARAASVHQTNPLGAAVSTARAITKQIPYGSFQVQASGITAPGGTVSVRVRFSVPNLWRPLTVFLFGNGGPAQFQGGAEASFRKEGW